MAHAPNYQLIFRKGKEAKRYAMYDKNGPRECARRLRQHEAGQLLFVKVPPPRETQNSFSFAGPGKNHGRWRVLRDERRKTGMGRREYDRLKARDLFEAAA